MNHTTQQHNVSEPLTTNKAPQAPTAPSIASSSMLVELSISTWTARKLDKRASKDITSQNYAAAGVANVNKKLLGNCAELDAVQKFTANVRNLHYSMTMPWSDTGMRLLPTAAYFKYHQTMTEVQNEYERLVAQFIDAYDWEISQAQANLGNLFSREEYPEAASIAQKFKFRFSYIPLPEAGDFRVDVGNEGNQQVKDHYQAYYEAQLHSAMQDVWQRAFKALTAMSERLDYGDSGQKKIFRDTLVSNVLDIVDLLDVCNITNDSQMSALRLKLENTLRGITPDALREDGYLRAETKRVVDDVIKALPSLDM
tara:strand:- start:713 stop:1648 length:936 start_codon:yes stop_codon:yes gene_type:complete